MDISKFLSLNMTFGSVESLTCGLFAATVGAIPGISKYYKGGLVTYSVEEKVRLLGIDETLINKYGVVSSEVAYEMAQKGRKVLNVDVCVSCTGNAGPTCEPGGMPVGRVYIGVAKKDAIETFELNLSGERNEIRQKVVDNLLSKLNEIKKN